MNDVISGIKEGIIAISHLLNQPGVKEGVKKIVGVAHFALGAVAVYEIYQILKGREISMEAPEEQEPWTQTALKVIAISAKIGMILIALTSPPGVFIISAVVGAVFSTSQLECVFGLNTIFAVNPWHPRHVVSIAASILLAPASLLALYNGGAWVCHKVCRFGSNDANGELNAEHTESQNESWLNDTKTRLFALFSEVTSRPVLHMGNQLASWIIKAI